MPASLAAPGHTRVAFVTEQHLGHATFAMNLRKVVAEVDTVDACWVPVHYAAGGWSERLTVLPESIRAMLRGRREVRAGFPGDAAVAFFNTQVPAMIGGRRVRRRPYVLCTDITPIQYDRMAEHYGHRADDGGPVAFLKDRWNRRMFRGAAATVGWSSWATRSMIEDYGVRADRAHVISPGVDLTRWLSTAAPPDGPVRILFVGADFARKGGPMLLEAFSRLPAGSSELLVVTRSDVPATPGVTVHHGLRPNDPALMELYRTSHVFALPSSAEAFGIAAVEASASGLPVVAARVGGLADIVDDGTTGYLVEPDDVDGLADALARLVGDPALRQRMGAAARARAEERFDAARNARAIVDLLLSCAA
jgi:glycosyltransferase involved in cell wall biosynthesis